MPRTYKHLTLITDVDKRKRIEDILEHSNCNSYLAILAKGCSSPSWLEMLGIKNTQKMMLHLMLPEEEIQSLSETLHEKLHLAKPGQGITYSSDVEYLISSRFPLDKEDLQSLYGSPLANPGLSSGSGLGAGSGSGSGSGADLVSGAGAGSDSSSGVGSGASSGAESGVGPTARFLPNKNNENKDMVSEKGVNNMYKKISVVVDLGKSDDVIEAARKAGAMGGTIIHGHGSVDEKHAKLFGFQIVPEKELVLILVTSDKVSEVVESIHTDLELDKPGNGIIFIEAIESTFGLVDSIVNTNE